MLDAFVLLYSVAVPLFAPLPVRAADDPHAAFRRASLAATLREHDAPDVDLWIRGPSTFRRGDVAQVEFRPRADGYVTIVRIDTDGRVRILYPDSPYDDAYVRAGRTYRVPGHRGGTFTVDDYTGMGYVFAIASFDRFDHRRYAWRGGWDYSALGDRVRGDPFRALDRIAEQLLWDDRSAYSTAYAEYYVDRHVDYPRFVCYDCHMTRSVVYFDPYEHHCTKYRVVVYDDPYYYPYRYYRGTRVVYVRQPRYEFKEPAPGERIVRTTAVERRRRTADGAPGSGGTRPGDGVGGDDSRPGRRRGWESDGPGNSNNAPGHTGDRGPRRDPPGSGSGNGPGRGNGPGDNPGNGGNGQGGGNGPSGPRPPRHEQGGGGNGNNGNGGGNGGGNGAGGSASSPLSERPTDDRPRTPRSEGASDRREPSAGRATRDSRPRPWDPTRGDSRDEPRREAGESRPSDRRDEPRGEPRSEPKVGRRPESRAEPTREARSEPRQEASRGGREVRRERPSGSSRESSGSSGSGSSERSGTRRRTP